MAGTKNGTFYGAGYNVWPTDAADIVTMQLTTDSAQIINVDGSPQGSEAANPGSLALDRTNGNIWKKQSGTGTTGWLQLSTTTGTGNVVGTPPSTDHAIARYDGASGLIIQNSVPTIDDTGNLLISAAVSGASLSATVANTSNTASSSASMLVSVGGGTADDPVYQASVSGVTTWTWGIDNSVNDGYVFAASNTLGTTNILAFGTAGNFLARAQSNGSGNTFIYTNVNNTAGSAASMQVQVAGTSAGDPTNVWTVSGGNYFTAGIDNSDSDKFKINFNSANLGTNDAFVMTTAGEITKPLQPAFLAYVATTISNVTGNNTVYTIIPDTEVFDQNGDFTLASGTFTAPVTGKYVFSTQVMLTSVGTATTEIFRLVTSNLTYRLYVLVPVANMVGGSIIVDMDAADTATFTIQVNGNGADTLGLNGASSGEPRCYFSGYLEC